MSSWSVEAVDGDRVRLTGLNGGVDHTISRHAVDELIQTLVEARASFRGPPPPNMTGLQVMVTASPTWWVQYDEERSMSLITFYHSLFGPVGAAFPVHVANEVQRLLQVHAFMYLENLASKPRPSESGE